MADTPEHAHRARLRAFCSEPAEAAALFQGALPQELIDDIDWNSLRLMEGSFVDDEMRGHQTDLLFEARCGKERFWVGLYLLFEHEPPPDAYLPFLLLKYSLRIWDADLLDDPQRTEMRPVVPLVLYEGARRGRYPKEFPDLIAPAFRDFPWVPRFGIWTSPMPVLPSV